MKTAHSIAEQLDLEYNWTTYFRTACIFTCRPNLDFITIFIWKQNIMKIANELYNLLNTLLLLRTEMSTGGD